MKKQALTLVAAAALCFGTGASAATTATAPFNVKINLTSACVVVTPVSTITLNYTSFGSALSVPASFQVKCTNTLPYTVALDGTPAFGPFGPNGSAGWSYTDPTLNVVYGLTLTTTGATGSGLAQTYSVTASMAGNQGGTCATSARCTDTEVHTITVTY